MKNSAIEAFSFIKPSTKKSPRLHTAALLNPAEVNVAFKDYSFEARHKLRGLWMLVGAVNGEKYSALKANGGNDVAAQLAVFSTPAGALCGVVISQIDAYQHRFVLPLYNSKVVEFLASTANLLNVYLECTCDLREGMLYNCLLAPDHLALARTMCMTIDYRQQEEFTDELQSLVLEILSVNLMPSLNAEKVLAVDVSFLLPRPRD